MRWLLLLALASGCATLGQKPLPYAARVYLLDAEEDLMTAAARADEAVRDAEHAQKSVDETQARFDTLHGTALKAEVKADVDVAKAQLTRAKKSADLLVAAQQCAELRYAASRAQAGVKFKIEDASERQANKLANSAETCEAKLEPRRDALSGAEDALAKARADRDRAPHRAPKPWLE